MEFLLKLSVCADFSVIWHRNYSKQHHIVFPFSTVNTSLHTALSPGASPFTEQFETLFSSIRRLTRRPQPDGAPDIFTLDICSAVVCLSKGFKNTQGLQIPSAQHMGYHDRNSELQQDQMYFCKLVIVLHSQLQPYCIEENHTLIESLLMQAARPAPRLRCKETCSVQSRRSSRYSCPCGCRDASVAEYQARVGNPLISDHDDNMMISKY